MGVPGFNEKLLKEMRRVSILDEVFGDRVDEVAKIALKDESDSMANLSMLLVSRVLTMGEDITALRDEVIQLKLAKGE